MPGCGCGGCTSPSSNASSSSASSNSDAGTTPASTPTDGGNAATCTCPTVEIQINNTPTANDDLVGLKCEHPAHRSKVPCRIRGTSADSKRTIVLTNPDGRLRFPESGDTTKTVVVPSDGSWVPFEISGDVGSNSIGDAVIEAHCETATGDLKGSKPVTVFWFDPVEIKVTAGSNYSLAGGRYGVVGGHAVNYSAKATIKPAGVDCSAPQVTNLRVGMIQNEQAEIVRHKTWSAPTITWGGGVATGTTVTAPTTMQLTINLPSSVNDSEDSVVPLYDQPGKTGTLDPNSLKPPVGCGGGAAATSFDTPSTSAPPTFTAPAQTAAGVTVGVLTYTLVNVKIDMTFTIWAVIFDISTNHLCALRQRDWSVHVDSAAAGQKAVPGASDSAASADPLTAAPFANTLINDQANFNTAKVGLATTTFTKT